MYLCLHSCFCLFSFSCFLISNLLNTKNTVQTNHIQLHPTPIRNTSPSPHTQTPTFPTFSHSTSTFSFFVPNAMSILFSNFIFRIFYFSTCPLFISTLFVFFLTSLRPLLAPLLLKFYLLPPLHINLSLLLPFSLFLSSHLKSQHNLRHFSCSVS